MDAKNLLASGILDNQTRPESREYSDGSPPRAPVVSTLQSDYRILSDDVSFGPRSTVHIFSLFDLSVEITALVNFCQFLWKFQFPPELKRKTLKTTGENHLKTTLIAIIR